MSPLPGLVEIVGLSPQLALWATSIPPASPAELSRLFEWRPSILRGL